MMILRTLWISCCLTAGVALLTAPVFAAVRDCRTADTSDLEPSAKAERRANRLFQSIAYRSQKALADVDQLQSPAFGNLRWVTRAHRLNSLRSQVNGIGNELCSLETIRIELTPLQQHALDVVSEKASLMADDTHAIEVANAHNHAGWAPAYRNELNNLYNEAQNLAQYVDHLFFAN